MTRKLGPTEFMESLGDSSSAVAESLRVLSVKGFTDGRGCMCPIAVAINIHAKGWGGIRVSSNGYASYNDCQIMDPQSTQAVKDFVKDFDSGVYPDLVGNKDDVERCYVTAKAKELGII